MRPLPAKDQMITLLIPQSEPCVRFRGLDPRGLIGPLKTPNHTRQSLSSLACIRVYRVCDMAFLGFSGACLGMSREITGLEGYVLGFWVPGFS